MVFRAFFDSSKSGDYLTLACYVASQFTWDSFNNKWMEILNNAGAPKSKKGAPYFHCREAYHNKDGYKDWDAGRIFNLATRLYSNIGNYILGNNNSKYDLLAFAITIKVSDYHHLIEKGYHLREINLLCLDHCLCSSTCHPLIKEENGQYNAKLELYFDQNEKYISIVKDLSLLKGNQRVYWENLVNIIEAVDMKENCGIQAADMLAWAANRYQLKGPSDRWALEFPGIFHSSLAKYHLFNKETLMALFDKEGNCIKDAKLPPIEIKIINIKEITYGSTILYKKGEK
jgi:hypothetical protein